MGREDGLSQSICQRLEALDGWSWDPIMEQWENGYEQLQSYLKIDSNKVPKRYVTSNGFNLGDWIGTQRRNKSKNRLTQAQIDRLEILQNWTWDPHREQWEERFEQLLIYLQINGDTKVPARYITSDGYKLGSWVSDQRKRKLKGLLSHERIERLEALSGWVWSSTD